MRRTRSVAALSAIAAVTLAGCGADVPTAQLAGASTVSVTNCGKEATFPTPAKQLFVSDGNQIAMVLALGASEQVVAVSRLERDREVLTHHYGAAVVDKLNEVTSEYPSKETVLAQRPDVMVGGYTAGYDLTKGLSPEAIREHGIAPYVLTESCLSQDGRRGIIDAWEAVRTDATNLGQILGREAQAEELVSDLDGRLAALRGAPQAETAPEVFVFDGGTAAPFTSGRFAGPEAIVSAAGARNVFTDVEDTWFEASWESVVAAEPDVIAIVNYPGQSLAEKLAVLRRIPGIKDLPAVRENRIVFLSYAMWVSGPLNIEAAEQLRKALEELELQPASDIDSPSAEIVESDTAEDSTDDSTDETTDESSEEPTEEPSDEPTDEPTDGSSTGSSEGDDTTSDST